MLGLMWWLHLWIEQPHAPLLAVCIGTVLIQVVCMLYANAWYLQHALGQVNRLKNHGYKGNELLLQLARRGGTSVLGVILSFFACGTATLVSNLASIAMVYSR